MTKEKVFVLEKGGKYFSKDDAAEILQRLESLCKHSSTEELATNLGIAGSAVSGIRKKRKGRLRLSAVQFLSKNCQKSVEELIGGTVRYSNEGENITRMENVSEKNRGVFMLELHTLGINFFNDFPEKERMFFRETGMLPISLWKMLEARKDLPHYKEIEKKYGLNSIRIFHEFPC